MVENATHIFQEFLKTGLHRRNNNGISVNWPNITYYVFAIRTGDCRDSYVIIYKDIACEVVILAHAHEI